MSPPSQASGQPAISGTGAPVADDQVTVLHVDDEPTFLELTRSALSDQHDELRIITETDPTIAVDRVADEEVECVVCDYQMPQMDGLDVLAAVRDYDADLPFILFTGRGSEEVASEAIAAGATDYIRKGPGSDRFARLTNRILEAVRRYRAEREADCQRKRLMAVIESLPIVLFVLDEAGTFQLSTGRGLQLLGLTPNEVVGESVFDLYDGHEDILADCRRALNGESVRATRTVQNVTFESWYRPLSDGGQVDRVIGVSLATDGMVSSDPASRSEAAV